MARRSNVVRQWVVAQYNWGLNSVTNTAVFTLGSDDANAPRQRAPLTVVRLLGSLNLQSTGSGVMPNGVFFTMGVLLKASTDPTIYRPSNGSQADMPWVFWKSFPLPSGDYGASPLNAFFGNLDALQVDWSFRGGHGTTLKHDATLALVGQLAGNTGTLPVGLTIEASLHSRLLTQQDA